MTTSEEGEPTTFSTIRRLAFASVLHALLAALLFVPLMIGATYLASTYKWQWELGGFWMDHVVPTIAVAALLAVGVGALRLVEPLAARIRPDASYARKLGAGVAIGAGVFVLICAAMVEVYYALGIIQKGSLAGGLAGIARGEWFGGSNAWTSWWSAYRLTSPKPENLPGLALPFALAGFARARELPLREQVAITAVFTLFWFGTAFVYWATYGDGHELAAWIVFWLESASIPLVARGAERLEARLLGTGVPEGARPPG